MEINNNKKYNEILGKVIDDIISDDDLNDYLNDEIKLKTFLIDKFTSNLNSSNNNTSLSCFYNNKVNCVDDCQWLVEENICVPKSVDNCELLSLYNQKICTSVINNSHVSIAKDPMAEDLENKNCKYIEGTGSNHNRCHGANDDTYESLNHFYNEQNNKCLNFEKTDCNNHNNCIYVEERTPFNTLNNLGKCLSKEQQLHIKYLNYDSIQNEKDRKHIETKCNPSNGRLWDSRPPKSCFIENNCDTIINSKTCDEQNSCNWKQLSPLYGKCLYNHKFNYIKNYIEDSYSNNSNEIELTKSNELN